MKIKKLDLEESNRVDDFKKKADYRYFATISGFVDKKFFTNENGEYDEARHKKYNERNTVSLQSRLKYMGLEYQKVSGIWKDEVEKSFVVWNTAYSWEDFNKIMLKMNEMYKQWAICIGRKIDEKYDITLYETDSLEDIKYRVTKKFESVNVADALKEVGTILTRKIYDKNGEIDQNKIKDAIKFEKLENNFCLAANRTVMGGYKRKIIMEELFKE